MVGIIQPSDLGMNTKAEFPDHGVAAAVNAICPQAFNRPSVKPRVANGSSPRVDIVFAGRSKLVVTALSVALVRNFSTLDEGNDFFFTVCTDRVMRGNKPRLYLPMQAVKIASQMDLR